MNKKIVMHIVLSLLIFWVSFFIFSCNETKYQEVNAVENITYIRHNRTKMCFAYIEFTAPRQGFLGLAHVPCTNEVKASLNERDWRAMVKQDRERIKNMKPTSCMWTPKHQSCQ